MKEPTHKPLGFGEILDQTFRMIKTNFKTMFMIVFLITIPVLALQTIILSLTGRDFFIGVDTSQNYIDQLLQSTESIANTSLQDDLMNLLSNFFTIFAYPLLAGAIILAVKYTRNGEQATAKELIKGTFPRYWPLFWSSILLTIILIAIMVPVFIIFALSIVFFFMENVGIGILMTVLLGLGIFIGLGLLITRWSLYLPAVLFEKVAPGLGKSFRLTKRQTWKFFGLFIILLIITSIISSVLQLPLFFLGDSVLFNIVTNLISMITSMVFVVGYAVMYFDATVRQEATDLKSMINEYEEVPEQP